MNYQNKPEALAEGMKEIEQTIFFSTKKRNASICAGEISLGMNRGRQKSARLKGEHSRRRKESPL